MGILRLQFTEAALGYTFSILLVRAFLKSLLEYTLTSMVGGDGKFEEEKRTALNFMWRYEYEEGIVNCFV